VLVIILAASKDTCITGRIRINYLSSLVVVRYLYGAALLGVTCLGSKKHIGYLIDSILFHRLESISQRLDSILHRLDIISILFHRLDSISHRLDIISLLLGSVVYIIGSIIYFDIISFIDIILVISIAY
jgi:hypothetical protein